MSYGKHKPPETVAKPAIPIHLPLMASNAAVPHPPHFPPLEVTKAIAECRLNLKVHTPYLPQNPYLEMSFRPLTRPAPVSKAQAQFIIALDAVERSTDHALYTQTNYDAQIARAAEYTDAFVNSLPDTLSAEKRAALKEKFHYIIEGTAGMETGWSPEVVMGSLKRPHSGVFQTAWGYIAEARKFYESTPAMTEVLDRHPEDRAVLNLSRQLDVAGNLPTTSFAGQGAAVAAGAIRSYQQFIEAGGSLDAFDGNVVYQNHLFGPAGGERFRTQLAADPDAMGSPGIGKKAFDGNYLITSNPFAGVNDLNPDRLVYSEASAGSIAQMLHDKFVHARNKMENMLMDPAQILRFESAYLPDWRDPAKKAADIVRVRLQQEIGQEMRDRVYDMHGDPCSILVPLPIPKAAPAPINARMPS